MPVTGMSDPTLTGGGRWGMVPAEVLSDRRLSRSARWLFSLMCSHANKQSLCRLRLERIADAEQVTVRAVQIWLKQLELAGRVERFPEAGKAHVYRVIRDPAEVRDARDRNAEAVEERKRAFTPPRPKRPAVDKPVRGSADPAESGGQGGEATFTPGVKPRSPPDRTVVNPGSPPSEQDSSRRVQQLIGTARMAPGGASGRARQVGKGDRRRRVKTVDRRQAAMLMPIPGGREGQEPCAQAPPDTGIEVILSLLVAAVERLLALNREGRLTEAEVRRVLSGLAKQPAPSESGDERGERA